MWAWLIPAGPSASLIATARLPLSDTRINQL
jgi:hypothetical protein